MHIISPIYQIFSCVARLVFPQFNARYVFRDCSSYCPWTYWFISCVISSSHFINSPHLDSLFVVHAAMCATVFYTRCTERDTHSFGLEINLRARRSEWKRKKSKICVLHPLACIEFTKELLRVARAFGISIFVASFSDRQATRTKRKTERIEERRIEKQPQYRI